jgi:DNA-binding XRE family transcriptional regulator
VRIGIGGLEAEAKMTWREQWEELRNGPEHRAYVLAEEAKHTIAPKVYSLRKERGLSQTELARLVGTRQPNISDIETAPVLNFEGGFDTESVIIPLVDNSGGQPGGAEN